MIELVSEADVVGYSASGNEVGIERYVGRKTLAPSFGRAWISIQM
jgi:hypothetical protein